MFLGWKSNVAAQRFVMTSVFSAAFALVGFGLETTLAMTLGKVLAMSPNASNDLSRRELPGDNATGPRARESTLGVPSLVCVQCSWARYVGRHSEERRRNEPQSDPYPVAIDRLHIKTSSGVQAGCRCRQPTRAPAAVSSYWKQGGSLEPCLLLGMDHLAAPPWASATCCRVCQLLLKGCSD